MACELNRRTNALFSEACSEFREQELKESVNIRIQYIWNRTADQQTFREAKDNAIRCITQMELQGLKAHAREICRQAEKLFAHSGVIGQAYRPQRARSWDLEFLKSEYHLLSCRHTCIIRFFENINNTVPISEKRKALLAMNENFADLLAMAAIFEKNFKENQVFQE